MDRTPQTPRRQQEGGMDVSGREHADDGGLSVEFFGVDVVAAAVIAFLSLIGVAGVTMSPLNPSNLSALRFGALLDGSSLFLAFILLPITFTAAVSRGSFRRESLASLAGLVGFLIGPVAAVSGLCIFLTCVLASRKVASMYNGKNTYYAIKSVGATIVLVFGLVAGFSAAYAVTYEPGFRADVKGNLTRQVTEQSIQYVSGMGAGTSPSNDRLINLATQLANNVSTVSIVATRRLVMGTVKRSGSFSEQQESLLNHSFSQARRQIPGRVTQNLEDRLTGRMDQGARQRLLRQRVERQVSRMIDDMFSKKRLVAVMALFLVLSTVSALRIPLQIVVGLLGVLMVKMLDLFEGL
ncbi:MAG: hypothetical protein SVU32_00455 [Candidatus Nanohaloarchaea archaeon]|nr:hypothetical protein [Candidatus Nanohaloarchaea archaeon]